MDHNKNTKLVNVRVKFLRPNYNNLKEFIEDDANVYIGRKGVVFVDGIRVPRKNSYWCNPYKVTKTCTRERAVKLYRAYIIDKLNREGWHHLEELRGKTLGCWCHPDACHGDVLLQLLEQRDTRGATC